MAKSQIEAHKIATFNLGEKGVVITKSPVHGEDGELAWAQNAVPNPEGGLSGIRKRFGFRALNTTAAAGGILAFISCNLEDPGVVAVNPAAFGRWLYSDDGGATWAYLEVQQTTPLADVPINYDGIDRLAFLHTLVDTDKTGLIAIDQIAGPTNAWEESAIPAEGFDPGRVAFPHPHALDLGDGYLYYWDVTGTKVRRWGFGADAELSDLSAHITGIVDWATDGTDLWLLCTADGGGTNPDLQQIYKVTVSSGAHAKVGATLTPTGGTIDGSTQYYRTFYSLCLINLKGTTPTLVIGGRLWSQPTETLEWVTEALVVTLLVNANDTTAATTILTAEDSQDVPTGYARGVLTGTQFFPTPINSLSSYSPASLQKFNAGDTITVGDIIYTAVEKANLTAPNTFFRGGVWETVSYPGSGSGSPPPGSIPIPGGTPAYSAYTYRSGLSSLASAVNGTVTPEVGSGTVANPLVRANAYVGTMNAFARASGAAGNGIPVAETSSVASWDASTLAGGVYTVSVQSKRVRVTDIINDATAGNMYAAVSSTGGHAEIKKIPYPKTNVTWTPAWTDVRTMVYPFGYISVWADDDELLYLETPEAITLQLTKGVKVDAAVFFLIGTGLATDATINLIALDTGALQRLVLPS